MKELISIFISFFKMGSVTFGGGYAMLPILRKECVEKNKWITEEQVMDYYAVSQGLPGIIAVNVSVFIGYRRRKFAGGIAAALGCVSPCIIIISIIAAFLSNFQDNLIINMQCQAYPYVWSLLYLMRSWGFGRKESGISGGFSSACWSFS